MCDAGDQAKRATLRLNRRRALAEPDFITGQSLVIDDGMAMH